MTSSEKNSEESKSEDKEQSKDEEKKEQPKDEEKKLEKNKKSKGKKGKKGKKGYQAQNNEANLRVTLPYKPKGEMFAVAETFQGGSRLQLICEDGERRMGRIPGKLRRRMWVRENVPWSFQDSKADVKFRYTPTQTSNLKRLGKIPEILDIY